MPGKIDISGLELDDCLDEVFREDAAAKVRKEHPYVKDLIAVLLPHPRGLDCGSVYNPIWERRKTAGATRPPKFEATVRRSFYGHCVDSPIYRKRKAPPEEGIFHSPSRGRWAVYPDKAKAWLAAKALAA